MNLEQLKNNLKYLKELQDEYLKYARNDENLNELIRDMQFKISQLK